MNRKYYRYFGGLLNAQEKWLNKIAAQGYRLVKVGTMLYEFEPCDSRRFQYAVDFIGQENVKTVSDYKKFLEEMGYKVFSKNINVNYSLGKVRWRPWAKKGARIATNSTTFNKELLIIEKGSDGKPFELHTTYLDKLQYYTTIRNAWLWPFVLFILCAIFLKSVAFGIFALITIIPLIIYQLQVSYCKHSVNIEE